MVVLRLGGVLEAGEVNGMDVLEVRQAAEIAFAHVREGKGPVLMECNTYRYRGHHVGDKSKEKPEKDKS